MDEHLQVVDGEIVYVGDDQRLTYRAGMEPLPSRVSTVIGDCVHIARSALDHLASRLIEAAGAVPNNSTAWPVMSRPRADGALPDVHPFGHLGEETKAALQHLQPYRYGDDFRVDEIWRLHQLWNADKHRELLATDTRGTRLSTSHRSEDVTSIRGTWSLVDRQPGATIYRLVPDSAADVQALLTFEITLDEGLPTAGDPIVRTLNAAIRHIRWEIVPMMERFL